MTPVVNSINILQAAFASILPNIDAKKLQNQTVTREKLQKHFCTKKACIKC